jgi:lipopolysaccharide transport system ATP-binding protein
MSVVIRLENVSKQYRLGLIGTNTLKGDIQRWWYRMRGLPDPTLIIGQENILSPSTSASTSTSASDNFVWALKDINFEVQQGEVLGIIGKNGAGKSTLLKLLSRVTSPTTGSIKVKGRVASLLEVGTGFHPELTGKENIMINGAILGMTKAEIRGRLDEIIDFAGVEKYIDTPVKRYSSGMYVRLAFAVAAHLEPEILIVDEVLAVGDVEFQKKAIGKMQDISSGQGRTVLFVSHNLNSISLLCSRAILIESGHIRYDNQTDKVINRYLEGKVRKSGQYIDLYAIKRNFKDLFFNHLTINNYPLKFGDDLEFAIKLGSFEDKRFENIEIGIGIQDSSQKRLVHISNRFINKKITHDSPNDEYIIRIKSILAPGIYELTLFLKMGEIIQDWLQGIIQFEIEDGNPYKFVDTKLITGVIYPEFEVTQR